MKLLTFLATLMTALAAHGQSDTILHNFAGPPSDGLGPNASLILTGTTFYGVTRSGGSNGNSSPGQTGDGILFKINADGSYNFGASSTDGYWPQGSLAVSGTTLYGTTSFGGANSEGAIFQINIDGSGYNIIHNFPDPNYAQWLAGITDGGTPMAGLVLSGSTLYGTTSAGGSGYGAVFMINTDGTGYALLHAFQGSPNDGWGANTALTLSGTTLYGTTYFGGANGNIQPGGAGDGTLYKLNIDASGYQVLYNFGASATDGQRPEASPTVSGSTIFGTTAYGGAFHFPALSTAPTAGTIFEINTDGTGYQVLHQFADVSNDGAEPQASLTLDGTTLYGTAFAGGSGGGGAIFQFNTDGSGYRTTCNFQPASGDAGGSQTALILSGSSFYGTTILGIYNANGAIFKFTPKGAPTPPPTPVASEYTLLLTATEPGVGIPYGTGYATLTFTKSGGIIAGSLADGRSFTGITTSGTSATLDARLNYPSAAIKGTLAGTIIFPSQQGAGSLSGNLLWDKPPQTRGAYPGIETSLNLIGSSYISPAKHESVLPGFTTGTLVLSDTGTLAFNPIVKDVTLTSMNQLIIQNPASDHLKVTIKASRGTFKGSFIYPGKKKPIPFGGVLDQQTVSGAGFFLGPFGSGNVKLIQ